MRGVHYPAMRGWLLLAGLLAGCGQAAPTAPTPLPAPTSAAVTLTDTVTGQMERSHYSWLEGATADVCWTWYEPALYIRIWRWLTG